MSENDDEIKYRCPNCERKTGVPRQNIPDREFENDPSNVASHRCTRCSTNFDPRSDSYIKWASGWYDG